MLSLRTQIKRIVAILPQNANLLVVEVKKQFNQSSSCYERRKRSKSSLLISLKFCEM